MDDLISRQAAIVAVLYAKDDLDAERLIKALPSAQRKKGKWIDEPVYRQTMDGKTWDGYTYCSECGEMHEYGYRSRYCPNCGAGMKRGEE